MSGDVIITNQGVDHIVDNVLNKANNRNVNVFRLQSDKIKLGKETDENVCLINDEVFRDLQNFGLFCKVNIRKLHIILDANIVITLQNIPHKERGKAY